MLTAEEVAPIPEPLLLAIASVTASETPLPDARIPTPLPETFTRFSAPLTVPDPLATTIPLLALPVTTVSDTNNVALAVGAKLIPELVKLRTKDFWIVSDLPETNWIPTLPELAPSIVSPRRLTTSLAPALMVMAAPLVARMPAAAPSQVMLTALLIVTGPKSAELSTKISPPARVIASAV